MNHSVKDLHKLPFSIKYYPHRKSKKITLRLKSINLLEATYPHFLPKKDVDNFIHSHIPTIEKNRSNRLVLFYKTLKDNDFLLPTAAGDILFMTGKRLGAYNKGGVLKIIYTSPGDFSSVEYVSYAIDLILKKLKKDARIYLSKRIAEIAEQTGFRYNKLSFRNQQTRWGSCSHTNNISLNIKLMLLSPQLIDYVLLHELVHTRVKNHSPLFWRELERHMGDAKKRRALLKSQNLSFLDI
jgi:predicted metal-dependent hydrolase